MQRAKTFMFVCLGLLFLAAAFHLGASQATASGVGPFEAVGFDDGAAYAVIGRTAFVISTGNYFWQSPNPIPGGSPVVAIGGMGAGFGGPASPGVILESGEVYQHCGSNSDTGWCLLGTFPAGAVPVARSSWGKLKARYREAAPNGR
jgi:hypothetical protein